METIFVILLTILVIITLLTSLYILLYNKIQFSKIRTTEAEKLINEELEKRYQLIMSLKDIIKKNTKMELDIFKTLEDTKKTNISSFNFDKEITKALNTINEIKEDYPKLEEKKEFKNALTKIEESNTKMDAAKSFYNKYNSSLIVLIKKFPSNIICLIHNIKIQPYYEAKDIFNEIDDGMKI